MDFQDLDPALDIRAGHDDLAIEAARTQQRRVEHVGTVGRRDNDDPLVRFEPVHLDQQLVERLFALVVTIAEAGTAMTTDRVDFVDEDDAGRAFLRLFEHVANAAGADADEHLDEVRARDGEERHARLTRNRAGEQRLAGARRTDEQRALGDLAAEAGELGRILEEVDDLGQLRPRFVDAGDIVKSDLTFLLRQHARTALAEAHRAAAGILLHLLEHEECDAKEKEERQRLVQQQHPHRRALFGLRRDRHILFAQMRDQRRVLDRIGPELVTAGIGAGNDVAADRDILDGAFVDLIEEFRIGDGVARPGRSPSVKHRHEQGEREQDADPDEQAFHPGVATAVAAVVPAAVRGLLVVVVHTPKISALRLMAMERAPGFVGTGDDSGRPGDDVPARARRRHGQPRRHWQQGVSPSAVRGRDGSAIRCLAG